MRTSNAPSVHRIPEGATSGAIPPAANAGNANTQQPTPHHQQQQYLAGGQTGIILGPPGGNGAASDLSRGLAVQGSGYPLNDPSAEYAYTNNAQQLPLGIIPGAPGFSTGGITAASAATGSSGGGDTIIRNVWKWNLEEQMGVLRDVVERYNHIALDCKFPGIIARPIGTFRTTSEYHYQTLRSNVDILDVIQIGLTFSDDQGNHPAGCSTWQFNFEYDPNSSMCSAEGMELLAMCGVDFSMHQLQGINVFKFGELLISSGLVLQDNVHWITFHSGYDLGYLLSIMLNKQVPVEERLFLKALKQYFPHVWDIKYVTRIYKLSNKTHLIEVAEDFQVRALTIPGIVQTATGGLNQAGSDSLITSDCFFEIKRMLGEINLNRVQDYLFGLGDGLSLTQIYQQLENEEKEDDVEEKPSSNVQSGSTAASAFQFGKMGGGG